MATLNVKNVSEELMERLRALAREHNRSLRGEVVTLLERAVDREEQSGADVLAEVRELRARYRPESGGPSAEELLAEDRRR